MIAMKYGTVPIVRNTGGLANTVFDADYARKPYHERNGYVFNDFDNQGLESALKRTIGLWYIYPEYFRELMSNGMRYDYSWNHPADHYLKYLQLYKGVTKTHRTVSVHRAPHLLCCRALEVQGVRLRIRTPCICITL